MRFFLIVLVVLFVFFSCNKEKLKDVNVSDVGVSLQVDRFDVDFYTSNKTTLNQVKNKYPYLFPKNITDSVAISKINNKDEQELFLETQKLYKDFSKNKEELISLFKHVKYYNPNFKAPKIVTMLSNIDYNSRVIYADSLLLISLDVYLGKNHKFYSDYPKYIKENNTKENIVVDVANAIIEKQLSTTTSRTFVEKMVFEGKKMYLLDLYLPKISDKLKIGYSEDKLKWSIDNEDKVWKYFIEKKLLFSTDTKLNKRFLDIAPFSKFYLQQDSQSPGRIGVWFGWQIVKSFMQNNDVSLQELLIIDSQELFNKSKYKPKK
ncbi:gliding motility lipoprotein GldB [Polaribacter sargassicola]|uniref:gliding motility lipoprotein GldB n=1 Tax=Polaribacter sargassicola TaxID=2836891 RepID=UPI001F194BD9|nr:gliding motility lipoprotein GldB [Polaribacter sp. DS7-9]MCG1037282.1 gliding motility lipoprotein GldB [Polaribacter sp. DS7-9]